MDEGKKNDTEKARMDLISPPAMFALARILGFGSKRYGDRNWELGIKYGRVMAALQRHLLAWWGGEDLDPETGENHLHHVLCNAMFLSHFVSHPEKYGEFDDRPNNPEKEDLNATFCNGCGQPIC